MLSKQYHLDLIEAAKSDPFFDDHNAMEIADFHGLDPEHVENDIIIKRSRLAENEQSKKLLDKIF